MNTLRCQQQYLLLQALQHPVHSQHLHQSPRPPLLHGLCLREFAVSRKRGGEEKSMTYKNTKDHHTERKREMCACVHTHTHTHTHTQTHTQLFAREQRGPINSRTGAVEIFNSCEQHPKGRRDSYLGTVECSVMTFCLSFFFVRFFCRPVCVIHEL
jgi:hypothetical protein